MAAAFLRFVAVEAARWSLILPLFVSLVAAIPAALIAEYFTIGVEWWGDASNRWARKVHAWAERNGGAVTEER